MAPESGPGRRRTPAGLVVGVGDLAVTADPEEEIITYGLGSCLGVMIHDPVSGVGGLLHAMLPSSSLDPAGARERPGRFIDTGLPLLFRKAYALGAVKERIVLKMAGAGRPLGRDGEVDTFQIGKRNILMARQMLWKNGVMVRKEDLGGSQSRTVALRLRDGVVTVRSGGESYEI